MNGERSAGRFVETRARFDRGDFEVQMMRALSGHLGVELKPYSMHTPNAARVEVEGSDAAHSVLVQLVANRGSFKSQYRNKAVADMFKLLWLRKSIAPEARIVLCVSETVAQVFAPGGWVTTAAADLGVEVYVYETATGLRKLIGSEREGASTPNGED